MISKEKFISLVNQRKSYDEYIHKLNKLGIFLTSNFANNVAENLFEEIMTMNFPVDDNEDVMGVLDWWMYDTSEKKIYKAGTKEVIQDLTSIESLYDYLIENCASEKGWEPCSELNYPDGYDCEKCVVKVKFMDDYEYYIYAKCPFGWNSLINRNALCKMVD